MYIILAHASWVFNMNAYLLVMLYMISDVVSSDMYKPKSTLNLIPDSENSAKQAVGFLFSEHCVNSARRQTKPHVRL